MAKEILAIVFYRVNYEKENGKVFRTKPLYKRLEVKEFFEKIEPQYKKYKKVWITKETVSAEVVDLKGVKDTG